MGGLLQGRDTPIAVRHRKGPGVASNPGPTSSPPPATTHRPAAADEVRVSVDAARCVGCLACATACRFDVLLRLPGVWVVQGDPQRCTGCRRCLKACPLDAITITGPPLNRRQVLVRRLRSCLTSTRPGGWSVLTDAPRFRTEPTADTLVPDLAVVRTREPGTEWLGPDDARVPLVVDIVSSTTRPAALRARHQAYWTYGVPTCWTLDQRTGQVHVQWSTRPGWFDRWTHFTYT